MLGRNRDTVPTRPLESGARKWDTVQTPIVDDVKDENPGVCFNVRREDVRSCKTQLTKLKRLVRYFKGERRWIQVVKFGDMSSEVTVISEEKRKSSSPGVAFVGRHLLKAYTRKEKIIDRSSAEAELYAAEHDQ